MSIFDKTGLSCIFANQLKLVLKERLQWFTDVENLSRGDFYFKSAIKQVMKLISNSLSTNSTYFVIPSNILPPSCFYGDFIFEHLNLDKLILFFSDNFDKYFSNPNSNLKIE
jgi:hypothetical protein